MMKKEEPGRIGSMVLLKVLWRSFFFQAANNYERMQNVGFAYCIAPALERLYEGEELRLATQRHLAFFNSHPYMTAALLGAVIKMEEEIAQGRLDPQHVTRFKAAMMGPMAAIGDSFFWASLRPMAAALAIFGVLAGQIWAPILFVILFNLFHLGVRWHGIFGGYAAGEGICQSIHRLSLVGFAQKSHYMTAVVLGSIGALFVDHAHLSERSLGNGMEPFLIGILTVIFVLALKRDIKMPFILYGFTLGCIALIASFNTLLPLK